MTRATRASPTPRDNHPYAPAPSPDRTLRHRNPPTRPKVPGQNSAHLDAALMTAAPHPRKLQSSQHRDRSHPAPSRPTQRSPLRTHTVSGWTFGHRNPPKPPESPGQNSAHLDAALMTAAPHRASSNPRNAATRATRTRPSPGDDHPYASTPSPDRTFGHRNPPTRPKAPRPELRPPRRSPHDRPTRASSQPRNAMTGATHTSRPPRDNPPLRTHTIPRPDLRAPHSPKPARKPSVRTNSARPDAALLTTAAPHPGKPQSSQRRDRSHPAQRFPLRPTPSYDRTFGHRNPPTRPKAPGQNSAPAAEPKPTRTPSAKGANHEILY